MDNVGYRWSVTAQANGEWSWSITDRDSGRHLLSGVGKSRAVAAAHIVRAIVVGMTIVEHETLVA